MLLRAAIPPALLAPFLVLGCRGEPVNEVSLPCSVVSVLQRDCQMCHGSTPSGGAPMSLVTYDDLHAPSKTDPTQPVYERVKARIHNAAAPMPPPPNPALSLPDLDALDKWIADGAKPDQANPEGTACDEQNLAGAGGAPGSPCDPSLVLQLRPKDKIAIPSAADTVLCYGVSIPVGAKRHVVSIHPSIGDKQLVHHVTLFATDQPISSTPAPCGPNGEAGWRIVTIWTPGASDLTLPDAAGFPLEGTANYAVQVHYENLGAQKGQEDSSGFDLCTSRELRPNDADVLVFGTENFDIPGRGSLDITCDYAIPPELGNTNMIDALPHMHSRGTVISTQLVTGNGTVSLGTRSPYTYNNQYWTSIEATAHTGDKVETRCAWKNPGINDVKFGETVNDEMCSSFTVYYPRVIAPGWSSTLPEAQSQCHPTN